MRFLIVDDSEVMRKSIIRSVVNKEDAFFECSDGNQAVEHYSKFLPDWVLMDIKMKNVNGLVATKNIKNNFPDAKIAILTSYDSNTYRNAAKKAGAERFFSKNELDKLYNELHN